MRQAVSPATGPTEPHAGDSHSRAREHTHATRRLRSPVRHHRTPETKASKEQYEMTTAPPRAPSKAEYDSLHDATPETSATMTVTPSVLEIVEKAAAPNAFAGAGGAAPEALRAAAASRTPRASKERYEMLEADEGDEPDGNLPPPAQRRTSGEANQSSGEQGDLMFATEGRIRSAVELIRREGGEL